MTHDADPVPETVPPATPTDEAEGSEPAVTGPVPTLAEALEKLLDGPAPVAEKDLKKSLKAVGIDPKGKKLKEAHEAELKQWLDDAYASGKAFHYPSGAKGIERIWTKDENAVLREAASRLLAQPKTAVELSKALLKVTKGTDEPFVEKVVELLLAGGELHEHPPKAEGEAVRHAATRYVAPKTLTEIIAEGAKERIAAAAEPIAEKELLKGLKPSKVAPPDFAFEAERVLAQLVELGTLHVHETKKGKLFANFAQVLPAWYETAAYKKDFEALLKTARKIHANGPKAAEDILAALRIELERAPAPPSEPRNGDAASPQESDEEKDVIA